MMHMVLKFGRASSPRALPPCVRLERVKAQPKPLGLFLTGWFRDRNEILNGDSRWRWIGTKPRTLVCKQSVRAQKSKGSLLT